MIRILTAAVAALLFLSGPGQAGLISSPLNQGTLFFRDISAPTFASKLTQNRAAGYRLVDFDTAPFGSAVVYSQTWEKNTDIRPWQIYYDLTSAQFATRWDQLAAQGYRLHDFESYRINGAQRYGGIWVGNSENWSWSSRRDLTSTEYATYFDQQSAAGRRLVDIEVYQTASGLRYAGVWYQNAGSVAWAQLRDMSHASFLQQLSQRRAAGFRLMDFESYQSGSQQRYAAIWERNPSGRSWTSLSDLTLLEFDNNFRTYRDDGYRLVDYERYNTSGGVRFAGIWVENSSRLDYPHRTSLNNIIGTYRADNRLPGISVAVIRNGDLLYQHGFGYADRDAGKVAHAETVYNAASVSKVIGATLMARLEAEKRLRDGTTVDLDLERLTSFYLPHAPLFGMPARHTHTVEQLLSHLSCVAHYDTTPSIENQTEHYDTQSAAVRSIWGAGLVQGCTIGGTVSYSTPGLTFAGAVLEKATGRLIPRLIREELAQRYGLPSMRVQWETTSLPANYERAIPYHHTTGNAISYPDSSWKMLGGGIEMNVVDLAKFGWKILDGEIVSDTTREDRLFFPVGAGCLTYHTLGICEYGIGWHRMSVGGVKYVEHYGEWEGARSYIRIYREKGLVIAIMSNRSEHTVRDVDALANEIAAKVFTKAIVVPPGPVVP